MGDDEGVRVSDADRERVAERLARAHGEGRLGLTEFDDRVRAAHGARTRADLAPLTVDLPEPDPRPAVAAAQPAGGGRVATGPRRRALAAATAVWAAVSAVNLAIWAVVALAADGPVYPWWIWVAGPWGVALAMRGLAECTGTARFLPVPPGLPGPWPGSPCGTRRRW